MVDLKEKYKTVTDYLKNVAPFEPEIAIVLGSGLGDFVQNIETLKSIPTSSIPNYPLSTVEGHKGFIHFAKLNGKNIILFQGRIHFYEGYKLSDCLLPVHIAFSLNAQKLLLTNAAGGVNPNFHPGDLILVSSLGSFFIKKELSETFGVITEKEKNNFLHFPSKKLNGIIHKSAMEENITLKQGVYWIGKGPSYETPAEIKMVGKFGIDAVGMSTAHEAIYAAMKGLDVTAISCITNYAAGIKPEKLSHNDVMETAEKVKEKFERLIKRIIKNI